MSTEAYNLNSDTPGMAADAPVSPAAPVAGEPPDLSLAPQVVDAAASEEDLEVDQFNLNHDISDDARDRLDGLDPETPANPQVIQPPAAAAPPAAAPPAPDDFDFEKASYATFGLSQPAADPAQNAVAQQLAALQQQIATMQAGGAIAPQPPAHQQPAYQQQAPPQFNAAQAAQLAAQYAGPLRDEEDLADWQGRYSQAFSHYSQQHMQEVMQAQIQSAVQAAYQPALQESIAANARLSAHQYSLRYGSDVGDSFQQELANRIYTEAMESQRPVNEQRIAQLAVETKDRHLHEQRSMLEGLAKRDPEFRKALNGYYRSKASKTPTMAGAAPPGPGPATTTTRGRRRAASLDPWG